jgi:D-xylose transport system ATP-binding protein
MQDITKDFPGVRALDRVRFELQPGEIHALVGENGAGKSTLIKILAGVYPAGSFQGTLRLSGQELRLSGVREAERRGIAVIHQELALIRTLTVGENIFLGRLPATLGVVAWDRLFHQSAKLLQEFGLDLNPRAPLESLSLGQMQLVEIARAFSRETSLLVLDEPTSALAENEVQTLMRILRGLKARGIACIYISHKLSEVFAIADRVTVLRDGKNVGQGEARELSEGRLISLMVGRELTELYPRTRNAPGPVLLEVSKLSVPDPERPGRKLVDQVSFQVRAGEVVGLCGLMGAGRTEILAAIFGAAGRKIEGRVKVAGELIRLRTPRDAIRAGIALVSEDRKRFGLIQEQSVEHNLTLASLKRVARGQFISRPASLAQSRKMVDELRIKTPGLETAVMNLSGGNQQKVVLGKWLLTQPRVLLLDEPTRGIDVGAKAEIFELINRLAAAGVAVVMASSELPELLGMCDRILVIRHGRLAGEFHISEATQEKLMAAAAGSQPAWRFAGFAGFAGEGTRTTPEIN